MQSLVSISYCYVHRFLRDCSEATGKKGLGHRIIKGAGGVNGRSRSSDSDMSENCLLFQTKIIIVRILTRVAH